ncbi:MAG: hypothetical protein AAFW89_04330 [Bacteroidota bacterium]
MIGRIIRALRALLLSGNPVKAISAAVIGVIIPYLLYAFLGGFGLALLLIGIIALIWWLANRKKEA